MSPFPNPPVPSSFTVGDINAGHATFDTHGVTFYGPDGITPRLRFDYLTGEFLVFQLNLGLPTDPNPAQLVRVSTRSVQLYAPYENGDQSIAVLELDSAAAADAAVARFVADFQVEGDLHVGSALGSSGQLDYDTDGGLSGGDYVQLLDPAGAFLLRLNPTRTDFPQGVLRSGGAGVVVGPTGAGRILNGDNYTGTTDGSGKLTIAHGLGVSPQTVVATMSAGARYAVTQNFTTSNFDVIVRNDDGTVAASVSVSVRWMAFA